MQSCSSISHDDYFISTKKLMESRISLLLRRIEFSKISWDAMNISNSAVAVQIGRLDLRRNDSIVT